MAFLGHTCGSSRLLEPRRLAAGRNSQAVGVGGGGEEGNGVGGGGEGGSRGGRDAQFHQVMNVVFGLVLVWVGGVLISWQCVDRA